ncbi:hypothetical protein KXD93_30400 [Mucilaginibacter sp. BJC16-A38]|uniref:hypothetical protein n=1 Tax=Mucilaginibacter phenanthrenivorans TaxID=1234842 RepID=UPI0021571B5B|nr:hypothetical protein [Mucilaginibacter phenanthrenivorans]MCR8562005.1 hypothetical protein [Mucilaginibacter phenanthrenivorans]
MKTIKLIILICCAVIVTACNNSKNPALSGVYVNQSQGEYGMDWDTLVINSVSLANKIYSVEHRVGFQKIRRGERQPKEFKIETWQAFWNSDQQVLAETEYGRQIRVSPDTPGVFLKNTLFRKIR